MKAPIPEDLIEAIRKHGFPSEAWRFRFWRAYCNDPTIPAVDVAVKPPL